MNITKENVDALNAVVKVNIVAEDYQNKVAKILQDYRKKANIPGFRKGQVPMGMIKKQYEKSIMIDEVNKLLQESLNRYLTEEKLDILTVNGIEINREEYKIVKEGQEIVLPRKEFELFYLLATKPGKVFTREEILDKVWGNEVVVGGRTIDVHIRKLREKIGDDFFKTIKGVGYKIEFNEN